MYFVSIRSELFLFQLWNFHIFSPCFFFFWNRQRTPWLFTYRTAAHYPQEKRCSSPVRSLLTPRRPLTWKWRGCWTPAVLWPTWVVTACWPTHLMWWTWDAWGSGISKSKFTVWRCLTLDSIHVKWACGFSTIVDDGTRLRRRFLTLYEFTLLSKVSTPKKKKRSSFHWHDQINVFFLFLKYHLWHLTIINTPLHLTFFCGKVWHFKKMPSEALYHCV